MSNGTQNKKGEKMKKENEIWALRHQLSGYDMLRAWTVALQTNKHGQLVATFFDKKGDVIDSVWISD